MLQKASIIFCHLFFYDSQLLKKNTKKSKSAFTYDDALLPYIINFFYFQKKGDNEPPFSLNVRDEALKSIIINYNQSYFELEVDILIHFFPKNIAILEVKIDNPLKYSKNNIEWNYSNEEKLALINNLLSLISLKWNSGIKVVKRFNKKHFMMKVEYEEDLEEFRSSFCSITYQKNKQGIIVRGFTTNPKIFNQYSMNIQLAMKKNQEIYNQKQMPMPIQQWIRFYMAPFVSNIDEKFLNPFNRTRMYSYIILLKDTNSENYNSFIESLLIQKKYNIDNINGNLDIENFYQNILKINQNINAIANENVVVIDAKDSGTHYFQRYYTENYIEKYFRIYLIVLYQKTKLEELILTASQLEFINDSKHSISLYYQEILHLKNNILFYLTKIDYTNLSNNTLRNSFYKYLRRVFLIKELHHEADYVINKIDNELNQVQYEKEEKRKETVNFWFMILGIFIAILSIPFRDIADLFSFLF